ncbi:MAG: NAD(P)H-binding protein [Chitinivibrionales bacterium]|nr:NAD(P)H-binding protein [Chitinivibrionales bacterium]
MILVTGASGNVGSEMVSICERKGIHCIAAGRKNRWRNYKHAEYRYLDFEDHASYEACRGVTAVFLVRPPQVSNIQKSIAPFLRACKEYGVEKIVFLSILGVEKLPFVPHFAIEKEILRRGLAHTFLRAGFFMQNLSTTHAREIRERNELVAPCGKGKTTFIHARDIAGIGIKALCGEIKDESLDVAGEDTLTYNEVAKKLSQVLNRKITYRSPPVIAFILYRLRHGTPFKFALIMVGIYMPTRFGAAEFHGTTKVADYLGRKPVGFDDFLREEKEIWVHR